MLIQWGKLFSTFQGKREKTVEKKLMGEHLKYTNLGNSLEVQWLRRLTSTAGSIPGQGTKIPHAAWRSQKYTCISILRHAPLLSWL